MSLPHLVPLLCLSLVHGTACAETAIVLNSVVMGANYVEVLDWRTRKTVKKIVTDRAAHNFLPKGTGAMSHGVSFISHAPKQ